MWNFRIVLSRLNESRGLNTFNPPIDTTIWINIEWHKVDIYCRRAPSWEMWVNFWIYIYPYRTPADIYSAIFRFQTVI